MSDDLDFGETIRGLIPGQKVFGRYTLGKILGRGGMGIVWQAHDETLQQDIAIKMLPEMLAADAGAVKELQRETARSQRLSHPNILRIYDFVEEGRACGITMELVSGGNLTEARVDQPNEVFEPHPLQPLVEQLCEALHYAHTRPKVVHRDLKPANLMLDAEGYLKIADFGIAASVSDSVSRVSQQAGSSGTPLYMSPQQMMGENPSVTDDIYALGATLFELLAGKPPFHTGNVMMQVLNKEAPKLNAQRRYFAEQNGRQVEDIPSAWEETIAACLAKEPADRPQTAKEVWQRLSGAAVESPKSKVESPPPPPSVPKPPRDPQPAPTSEPAPQAKPSSPPSAPPSAKPQPKATPAPEKRAKSNTPALVGLLGVVGIAAIGWSFGLFTPHDSEAEAQALREKQEAEARVVREAFEANTRKLESERDAVMALVPHSDSSLHEFVIPELNLRMMPIPAGAFIMGSPLDEEGRSTDEGPQHWVVISQPFWMGQTEVTNAQWQAVMGSLNRWNRPLSDQSPNFPKCEITREEALEFCRKLTERERQAGRLPRGYQISLPTEAQWEYAARAGATTAFLWGDQFEVGRSVVEMSVSLSGRWGRVADKNRGKFESDGLQEVGGLLANAWGLYDVHGNVAEICFDYYAEYGGEFRMDPVVGDKGLGTVLRGGREDRAWEDSRFAFRDRIEPDDAGYNFGWGFRIAVVRDPSVPDSQVGSWVQTASSIPEFGQKFTVPELDIAMVPIEPGTFMMGSPEDEAERRWDERQHQVTLTQPYWLGATEVTQRQWVELMDSTVREQRDKWHPEFDSLGEGPDHPIYLVSWDEGMEFCRRLTERERVAGRLPEGYVYRFPTEAQWAYACRAGTTEAYAGELDAMAWYESNSLSKAHLVGQKQANAWGLYDMHGNVWEWCLDWYNAFSSESLTDPAGPESGSRRVSRGGSWWGPATVQRSAARGNSPPDQGLFSLGFRVALAPAM